jgi:hypothetical protein
MLRGWQTNGHLLEAAVVQKEDCGHLEISKKEVLLLYILIKGLLSPMDTSLHQAGGPQYLLFSEE